MLAAPASRDDVRFHSVVGTKEQEARRSPRSDHTGDLGCRIARSRLGGSAYVLSAHARVRIADVLARSAQQCQDGPLSLDCVGQLAARGRMVAPSGDSWLLGSGRRTAGRAASCRIGWSNPPEAAGCPDLVGRIEGRAASCPNSILAESERGSWLLKFSRRHRSEAAGAALDMVTYIHWRQLAALDMVMYIHWRQLAA